MNRARKTFKAILAALLVGVVISVSSWAFAQGGGISASVKDFSNNMTAPDVIELSDMTPNRIINISMGEQSGLEENPMQTKQALSWETGAGKSYLIPALEILAFLLLLNGYDRLAYPNSVEPSGEKPATRTCQPFGTTSTMGPGWSTRTPST